MTEVTRENYATLIPEIIEKLQKCTFVAIDAEYTGLFSPGVTTQNSLFDSPAQRYEKLRKGFANFQISQFGLAIFSRTWERNEYFVDAYNIYLYPVAFDDFNDKGVLQCQVSSLNFLSFNNFDFNKFIKSGVPYLRKDSRNELWQYLKANPMFMRWMENRDRYYFPTFIEKLEHDDAVAIVENLDGFSKVIRVLSKLKKPIVGHNMLMDLLLIYKQFYEDLPVSLLEFKERIHELFPNIYDSKHIAASLRRDLQEKKVGSTHDKEYLFDTSLFALYTNTASPKDFFTPFVTAAANATREKYQKELETGLKSNLEGVVDSHCHEAGLDAVITGAVLLRLAHMSAKRDEKYLHNRTFPPTIAETFSALNSWKNCVNVVRAPIRFLRLDGEDPPIDKPNWIRVKVDPTSEEDYILDIVWLRNYLPKFGDVEIIQIDKKTALLACSAWSSARNIWISLEEEGFILSAEEFPNYSQYQYGGVAFVSVAAVTVGAGILLCGLLTLKNYYFLK